MHNNISDQKKEKSLLGGLLSDVDFRRIWVVGSLSMSNQWLEMLAISLFVYNATQSAMAVTLANFARVLPMALFGSLTGAIADRVDRRKLLIAAFLLLFFTSTILGLLALLQLIEIWHITVGMFMTGVVFSTDFPVRRNMLGDIAGLQRIGGAMGLDSVGRNATRVLGPLLGGALMEYVGLHGAYFVIAAVYVIVIFQLIQFKTVFPTTRTRKKTRYITTIIQGFNYARRKPAILGFLMVTISMNVFAFPYMTMVPVIGRGELGLSALLIGILISVEGSGSMIGSLLIAFLKTSSGFKKIYFFGCVLFMFGIIGFGLSKIYVLSLIIVFVAGLGMAGFSTMQATLPFLIAPPHMRARILGLVSVCIGMNPFGILLVGTLATTLGPSTAIIIMAASGLLMMAGLFLIIRELT